MEKTQLSSVIGDIEANMEYIMSKDIRKRAGILQTKLSTVIKKTKFTKPQILFEKLMNSLMSSSKERPKFSEASRSCLINR